MFPRFNAKDTLLSPTPFFRRTTKKTSILQNGLCCLLFSNFIDSNPLYTINNFHVVLLISYFMYKNAFLFDVKGGNCCSNCKSWGIRTSKRRNRSYKRKDKKAKYYCNGSLEISNTACCKLKTFNRVFLFPKVSVTGPVGFFCVVRFVRLSDSDIYRLAACFVLLFCWSNR